MDRGVIHLVMTTSFRMLSEWRSALTFVRQHVDLIAWVAVSLVLVPSVANSAYRWDVRTGLELLSYSNALRPQHHSTSLDVALKNHKYSSYTLSLKTDLNSSFEHSRSDPTVAMGGDLGDDQKSTSLCMLEFELEWTTAGSSSESKLSTKEPAYFIVHSAFESLRKVVDAAGGKVALDRLETDWTSEKGNVDVVDENAFVILPSQQNWEDRPLNSVVPEVTQKLARASAYRDEVLQKIDSRRDDALASDGMLNKPLAASLAPVRAILDEMSVQRQQDFIVKGATVPSTGSQLIVLSDTNDLRRQALVASLIAALTCGLLLLVSAMCIQQVVRRRNDDIRAKLTLQAAYDQMESKIIQRTSELQAANERLEKEVQQRKQAEKRTERLAYYDVVTGLPNRALLEDRLNGALARASRSRGAVAVLFIDIDRFKNCNDTLGHHIGDVLLVAIGKRLSDCVRRGETVARHGGDEFVVILENIDSTVDAASVAEKILASCSEPFVCEGVELHTTVSVGISMFPEHGRDPEVLVKNADLAMYRAKSTGRSNYQIFTHEMNRELTELAALENDLHRAMERDEFDLYYQPIVDLETGMASGVEALLRWRHPRLGLLSPERFMALAEDSGIIIQLGQWIICKACAEFGKSKARGSVLNKVAINLSVRQLQDRTLLSCIASAIHAAGMSPNELELEITESSIMTNLDMNVRVLQALRDMGVRIAIDDFGTGYSSFSYLKLLPVDVLKIDRSFVRDLDVGQNAEIVDAIIALAHLLGLKVVAEGVESRAQVRYLISRRCDLLQGFYFSRPRPSEAMARWCDSFRGVTAALDDHPDRGEEAEVCV